MFFLDKNNDHYALADIDTYRVLHEGAVGRTLRVNLKEKAHPVDVVGRSVDLIERAGSTVIPAEPGTFYLGHQEQNTIWFEPVLAWLISLADEPVPITVQGPNAGVINDYAIVHPNASVSAYDENHRNLTAYLESKNFTPEQMLAARQAFATAKR